ncbi:HAAS signaling domain-containing protein [Phenylobacterium deserti]|uniref:Uncharacterized protein n=1 Tax=Phenylobacterium deserti TaxID=1914756 RepID=A0A328A9Y2_9CAUL|nr:hypothetical protein [Phenylobacterium deserti]RAK51472.1 hypothetical protein DJ018_16180 [Phenylobacterium deserti]
MELIERYLAAIARQIPGQRQRDDVVAELRDELLSQIEDREAALGRPLEKKELEALVRDFGPPTVVAARYWPMQRLIGPEIFPFYVQFLRAIALVALGVQIVVWGVGLASGPDPTLALPRLLNGVWGALLMVFAWVTLVFVVGEHLGVQKALGRKWKPSDLPPVQAKRGCRRGPFELVFEAATGVVFILWWTGLIQFDNVMGAGERNIVLSLSPGWDAFYWPVLAVGVLQLLVNLIELARPAWNRLTASANVVLHLSIAALSVALLKMDRYVVVTGQGATPQVADSLNMALHIACIAVAVVSVFQAGREALRALNLPEPRLGRMSLA